MKKIKNIISVLLCSILIFSFSSCGNSESSDASGSQSAESDSSIENGESSVNTTDDSSAEIIVDHDHADNEIYYLDLTVSPSENEAGIINVVITLNHTHTDLLGLEFSLAFPGDKVEGVYTTNDEMAKTMTVVPMYETTAGTSALSYEQICTYDKKSNVYDCKYLDLLSYPSAIEGVKTVPLKNPGDLVITIPFKVVDGVSAGETLAFSFSSGSVRGTTSDFEGVIGAGGSAEYTLTANDVA